MSDKQKAGLISNIVKAITSSTGGKTKYRSMPRNVDKAKQFLADGKLDVNPIVPKAGATKHKSRYSNGGKIK